MVELSTQYLGMDLKNPVIAGSSGLTDSVKSITVPSVLHRKAEDHGQCRPG